MKYKYLHKFIDFNNFTLEKRYNWFEKVTKQEIDNAEHLVGFEFPQALKEFWLEIGYGALHTNIQGTENGLSNTILTPNQVAAMILKDEENAPAIWDVLFEDLTEDDIPFFEIANGSDFLVLKKNTNYPDAVYRLSGKLVETSFEKFIWRLYHESADYYLYVDTQPPSSKG